MWETDGARREAIPFCTDCLAEGVYFPFDTYRELWPLELGKTVEFVRRRGGDAWSNRVEVLGTESLELEIGAVDVYVTEVDSRCEITDEHYRDVPESTVPQDLFDWWTDCWQQGRLL